MRAFDGFGTSKGGSGSVQPPSASSSSISSGAAAPPIAVPTSDEFDEDEALAKALQLSLAEAANSAAAASSTTTANLTESTKATNQEGTLQILLCIHTFIHNTYIYIHNIHTVRYI